VNRRLSNKEQKKLADNARLLRAWKAFHREELETVLAGPHGVVLGELLRMIENLKYIQPAQLIGFTQAIDWSVIDYNTRLTVLHELNKAVAAVREKHRLDPIDDPLPGQPESPFRTIKAIVLAPSPRHEGAHRGEARSKSSATTDREYVS
jgi:hypothetical protein